MAEPRLINKECFRFLKTLEELQNAFPEFLKAGWFICRTPRQIGEYCDMIATARANFWLAVRRQYPETSFGAWSCTSEGILASGARKPDSPNATPTADATPAGGNA
jgi:hypothetical protein